VLYNVAMFSLFGVMICVLLVDREGMCVCVCVFVLCCRVVFRINVELVERKIVSCEFYWWHGEFFALTSLQYHILAISFDFYELSGIMGSCL
jgi:hypothetical protein